MENPEHIKPIIKRKADKLAGTWIKCKFCEGEQAQIRLEDRRWRVFCVQCGSDYYLKEQRSLDNAPTL